MEISAFAAKIVLGARSLDGDVVVSHEIFAGRLWVLLRRDTLKRLGFYGLFGEFLENGNDVNNRQKNSIVVGSLADHSLWSDRVFSFARKEVSAEDLERQ